MKKYLKKIIALICVLTLCVGTMHITATAGTTYNSTMTIGTKSDSSSAFYVNGTDGVTTSDLESGWGGQMKAIDAESGVYVNGDIQTQGYIQKCNSTAYYVCGFDAVNVGDVVTIKGTFGPTCDGDYINVAEADFLYIGSQWVDYYTGSLNIKNAQVAGADNTKSDSFYLRGTDGLEVGMPFGSSDWANYCYVPFAETDGVFLNGVRQTSYFQPEVSESGIKLVKYWDDDYYYITGIEGVETSTTVAIKGSFWVYTSAGSLKAAVAIEESNFKWNGTYWEEFYVGSLTVDSATNATMGSSATVFYIKGTDRFPLPETDDDNVIWNSTIIPIDGDDESGIFINGVRIENYYSAATDTEGYVRLRKYTDGGYHIQNLPDIVEGSIVTIKGTFKVYTNWLETNVFDTTPIVFEESSFKWTGSQWVDYVEIQNYPGVLSYTNRDGAADFVYLDTTDTMPSICWDTQLKALDDESGIYINGTKNEDAFMKRVDSAAYYVANFGTLKAGDILKIKGLFGYSANNETVSFDEAQFQWDGTQWEEYVEIQNYPGVLSYTNRDGAANYVYLDTTDTMPSISWDTQLKALDDDSGIYINGTKNEEAFMKKVDSAAYYVENFGTLSAGDILKIKGLFGYSANNETVSFDEAQFQWDGTKWEEYVEIINYPGVLTYTNRDGAANYVYLDTTDTMPSISWDTQLKALDDDSGIYINGTKNEEAFMKKVDSAAYYVENFGTLSAGDILKIKGLFGYSANNETVSFDEAQFQWDGTKWEEYVESTNYTGTPVFSTIGNCGNEDGFYFTSEDGAPYDADWNLKFYPADGDTNGVFVNGVKKDIFLKKFGTNQWYVCIKEYRDEQESDLAFSYSDLITIKGTFYIGDTKDTVTFTEASFEFNGKHFGEGTFEPIDIAVTGLDYKSINYNEESDEWNLYFTLNKNIEGDVNDVYFPYMAYEVNGTEHMTHWWKSSSSYEVDGVIYYSLFMTIPGEVLPQTIADDTEYTITLKAGASQGRNNSAGTAREDGIRLTEDYEFVVGTDYNASAPSIDYVTAGGGTASGIYLSCTDNFPITGWEAQLKKTGENAGVYKYDTSTGTYVATEVFIKKYADNKYYVALADVEEGAEEGTILMLKGTFTFLSFYDVTFKTAKYIYTNGAWQTYTATTDTEEKVEWYGDATGDATKAEDINSQDLVRIKRYLAKEIEVIQSANADLNSSGNIDEHDVALERWLLVNGTTYFVNGSNILGLPTYEDNQEMRLAAYISPELDDDDGFQWYKEAGFTTLMGEGDNRAVYGTEGLDAYMKKAEEYGLDVLVRSSAIQDMLAGTLDVNAAQIESIYNDLSTTYGDTFRGLFLWDEPTYSELQDHTAVLNTLNSLNTEAGKDMYTACLPIYSEDETVYGDDTSLSLNEKYSKYANAYGSLFGEFTYDFYPFKHSCSSFLGIKYNEKDYMRSDWFNNLELAATAGHGKFENGIVVQSYAENKVETDHYRDVTEADVSFQVYSALAYGMKSIQYFTYGEHWDTNVYTTNCMIYDGQKTDIYEAVKSVNTEIKKIDHILLNYNWQGTIGISVNDEDNIMDSVAAYTSPRIDSYTATNDAIIGCLKDVNGYDGFMLVSASDPADNTEAITMSVEFNNADHAKVYIDGVESTVELQDGKKLEITLNPGQGIFVIPYIAE